MDDDQLILKLSRQYSENELVKLLKQKIKSLQVTIGELKSDIQELEDTKFTLDDVRKYGNVKRERDYWMQKH